VEIRGKRVLILGGWGLVGSAIAREIVLERPESLVLTSLTRRQSEDVVRQMGLEFPDTKVRFVAEWGDVFQRAELKDVPRDQLLADPARRAVLVRDTLHELTPEILEASALHQIIERHRPDVIVDCINSATAFAYQDLYRTASDVARSLEQFPGETSADALRADVERLLCTSYTPQLIRHVQILYASMVRFRTGIYVKIGTSGTGGMGLNIPYTHSEERPSRVLLSKSAIAGAHTMLLFLMGRTPGGPIIKEFKPTALIAWKQIARGKIARRGVPLRLYDLDPEHAIALEGTLRPRPPQAVAELFARQEPDELEAVFIDTGENGIFSAAEFEAVTMVGQMQFITPEEIAQNVIFEIKGGNTGHDVINALDEACLGPTYRAGELRSSALRKMRELESRHGARSVAFEMLGPPKLSKILWEADLLRRIGGDLKALAQTGAEELSRCATEQITTDRDLRRRILSIGIPILMPDGRRFLRGPEIKVPNFRGQRELSISAAAVDRWADEGWVDLRVSNFQRWRERLAQIDAELSAIPFNDTSSRYDRDRDFWFGDEELNVGKLAGWIFINEDKGRRMKS
jgi:hypothetical protein